MFIRNYIFSKILAFLRFSKSRVSIKKKGLLIILIDGLSYKTIRKYISLNKESFLGSILKKDYKLYPYYSDIPATTTATEAELFFGNRYNIPGFSWYDRILQKSIRGNRATELSLFEDIHKKDLLLLKGGSGIATIYSAGSTKCDISSRGLNIKKPFTIIKNIHFLLVLFLNPVRFLLINWLILRSLIIGIYFFLSKRSTKKIYLIIKSAFSRILLCDIISYITELEILRGSPVVFADLLLYDDLAHEYGPCSKTALSSLRLIDWHCKSIFRTANKTKREYNIIFMSDHGQHKSTPYAFIYKKTIKDIIYTSLVDKNTKIIETFSILEYQKKGKFLFLIPTGSILNLYFSAYLHSPPDETLLNTCFIDGVDALLQKEGVGMIMYRKTKNQIKVASKTGYMIIEKKEIIEEKGTIFEKNPDNHFISSLKEYSSYPNNGDVTIFGAVNCNTLVSFEEHFGTHGGFYGEITNAFMITKNKDIISELKTYPSMKKLFSVLRSATLQV